MSTVPGAEPDAPTPARPEMRDGRIYDRTHPDHPDYSDKIDAGVLKIAGVVVIGAIMSILDITVVNVALPVFQTEFATDPAQPLAYSTVAWTVTAYTLALATVIPLTGWAADRFGTKRLYLLAVTLFTLGSILCATADSLNQLVIYRALQGLGGGMLMPLGMTILTRAAGPDRVGRVMAIMGIPMLLGPIFGPILGGVLIDQASWHWIFLINLPIGLAALYAGRRVLVSGLTADQLTALRLAIGAKALALKAAVDGPLRLSSGAPAAVRSLSPSSPNGASSKPPSI